MDNSTWEHFIANWDRIESVIARWGLPVTALAISFFGLVRNRRRSHHVTGKNPEHPINEMNLGKEKRFGELPEELVPSVEKLKTHMEKEQPFLNPELCLDDLASDLNLKPYQVSEVLNRGMGTTFYEYINQFRIAEVKKMLTDPKKSKLSMLNIAHECGFNSKSVFNETFRKIMGMTPSDFRKSKSG